MNETAKTVLWWGRFDPDYSRNRILRQAFSALGWRIIDFHPRMSALGHIEAALKSITKPDLLWIPAFRQRDVAAATRWAKARQVPVIFDPMISAYDKQVFERRKFPAESGPAKKLLASESALFAKADRVIADTAGHAAFFIETLNQKTAHVRVIALGAEEQLFTPAPLDEKLPDEPLELLFYGSFIGLQAPEVIVEAAKQCDAPVRWTLLGDGPLKSACEAAAAGHPMIRFEDYLDYEKLPERIHRSDILLGVFGASDKAARVIPNKVYQALACGRPVITRASSTYPAPKNDGLIEVPPDNPKALADAVHGLHDRRAELPRRAAAARRYYEDHFSIESIHGQLAAVLDDLLGG